MSRCRSPSPESPANGHTTHELVWDPSIDIFVSPAFYKWVKLFKAMLACAGAAAKCYIVLRATFRRGGGIYPAFRSFSFRNWGKSPKSPKKRSRPLKTKNKNKRDEAAVTTPPTLFKPLNSRPPMFVQNKYRRTLTPGPQGDLGRGGQRSLSPKLAGSIHLRDFEPQLRTPRPRPSESHFFEKNLHRKDRVALSSRARGHFNAELCSYSGETPQQPARIYTKSKTVVHRGRLKTTHVDNLDYRHKLTRNPREKIPRCREPDRKINLSYGTRFARTGERK
ncbi:hypothetical protein EVAR_102894_1 [Eumeta japonica]|uniref:Uncharacterized protein n=1 Tax=Eumeta variegata TaxID=151549 RepID=A0A4C1ZJ55_EUMVA|nr:hypothetical protein EVAR_102894_1 [Eumeta japonica]